ncbi:MAG: sugar phosphate isomerase/epimerase [Bacteroidaceae bacterium]|nr:sugar phosphate isomerase/epimerase [Bacteroidaceae bacterium]
MEIAIFYENLKTAVDAAGVSMEEALQRLVEAGMKNFYANYEVLKKDLPDVKPLMDKYGIGVEGLYGFFDFSHNPKEEKYKECVDLAKELSAGNVLLLPGIILPDEGEKKDELTENMRAGLETAAAYGEEKGVKVTLEDFDGMVAPYNSVAGLKWFMDNTKGLTCAFDTGNFVMYGEDSLEAFELFKDKIATVHVKDRSRTATSPKDKQKECADGSIVYPCPVGKGYIKIPEIVNLLKTLGYDGGLIAEMYDCDPDTMLDGLIESVKYLKALL